MSLKNLRRAALIGFFVALFAVFVFIGRRGNETREAVAAQENRASDKNDRLKMENPDALRANRVSQTLARLFTGKEVNFDAASLLSNRVEASQILRVIFTPVGKNFNGGEFSVEKPVANSAKRGAARTSEQPLTRQRAFELSPTQILIVSVDGEKRILWWDLQPDPRVFRAETADAYGVLIGGAIYRQNAEMLVAIPAVREIEELYFYSPNWEGENYSLELIGNLDLNNSGPNE